ncbi:unnamed protein product, partial [Prorocentrum cordatum]
MGRQPESGSHNEADMPAKCPSDAQRVGKLSRAIHSTAAAATPALLVRGGGRVIMRSDENQLNPDVISDRAAALGMFFPCWRQGSGCIAKKPAMPGLARRKARPRGRGDLGALGHGDSGSSFPIGAGGFRGPDRGALGDLIRVPLPHEKSAELAVDLADGSADLREEGIAAPMNGRVASAAKVFQLRALAGWAVRASPWAPCFECPWARPALVETPGFSSAQPQQGPIGSEAPAHAQGGQSRIDAERDERAHVKKALNIQYQRALGFQVIYCVHSLRPHLHGPGDALDNFCEHCRKMVGNLFDMELGFDPTYYAHAATWGRWLKIAGPQPTSRQIQRAGGGTSGRRRGLREPPSTGALPVVALPPATLQTGDNRFQPAAWSHRAHCDNCKHRPVDLRKSSGGAWVNAEARRTLAASRLEFDRRVADCWRHCASRWKTNQNLDGKPVSERARATQPAEARAAMPAQRADDDTFKEKAATDCWKSKCDRCPSIALTHERPRGQRPKGMSFPRPGRSDESDAPTLDEEPEVFAAECTWIRREGSLPCTLRLCPTALWLHPRGGFEPRPGGAAALATRRYARDPRRARRLRLRALRATCGVLPRRFLHRQTGLELRFLDGSAPVCLHFDRESPPDARGDAADGSASGALGGEAGEDMQDAAAGLGGGLGGAGAAAAALLGRALFGEQQDCAEVSRRDEAWCYIERLRQRLEVASASTEEALGHAPPAAGAAAPRRFRRGG